MHVYSTRVIQRLFAAQLQSSIALRGGDTFSIQLPPDWTASLVVAVEASFGGGGDGEVLEPGRGSFFVEFMQLLL